MQTLVAIFLLAIALILFWAWRTHKISNDTLNAFSAIFTVIAGIGAIVLFIVPAASLPPFSAKTSTPEIEVTKHLPANTAVFTLSPPSTPLPATPLPPTDTPFPPTFTPTPEFHDTDVWVPISNDVYIIMHNDFEHPQSGRCYTRDIGFAVNFDVKSQSGLQFLLRFDPNTFHAEDDQGHKFKLIGAGRDGCRGVGPQVFQGAEFYLIAGFEGQITLDSHYLVITADSINGVRLVFHKPL